MVVGAGPVEVEEADVEGAEVGGLQIGEAVRCGEIEVSRAEISSLSEARKTATRVTSRVWGGVRRWSRAARAGRFGS